MSLSINDARMMIRGKGLRATTPRVAVLRVLAEAGRPLTHSEVVGELQNSFGDQATIYRTLITFTKKRISKRDRSKSWYGSL